MSCHVSVGITTQTQVLCSNKSSPTTKHIFEYQVLRHYLISTFFHFIATLWDKAVSVLHSTLTNTEKTAFTNGWPSCFSLFTMQCSGCVWCQECSIIVLPPVLFPVRAIRAVPLTGDGNCVPEQEKMWANTAVVWSPSIAQTELGVFRSF